MFYNFLTPKCYNYCMKKAKELIIFDLDGTLIDSAPDLVYSINLMLEEIGRETFSAKEIDSWVGNGAKTLVSRALSGSVEVASDLDDAVLTNALAIFLAFYKENVCVHTTLYAGVSETLLALKNQAYIMAIVTNKPYEFVTPILKKLELFDYFDLLLGGDSLSEKKPNPLPLLHVCETFNISVKKSIMIGDSKNDILAASSAQMDSIGVTYGYNYGEDISIYSPTIVVKSFSDILKYIGK